MQILQTATQSPLYARVVDSTRQSLATAHAFLGKAKQFASTPYSMWKGMSPLAVQNMRAIAQSMTIAIFFRILTQRRVVVDDAFKPKINETQVLSS